MKLMNFSENTRKVFQSEENLKATTTAIHDLCSGVKTFMIQKEMKSLKEMLKIQ